VEKYRFFSILAVVCLVVALALSSSLVVSAQEEPTEEPTVELTEEPTAEPTEEPTAEPTEEPTAEPTEEPTAEPTEEPTAEPTEEPTAEPTEEPTAEPTEEPTAEPTEEPTAEPTEEPTVEPTEEPTLEPTEEPIVEPAGGEVGATAFGAWTTEAIAVQNISGGSATAQLALYQGGGSDPVQTIDLGTIAANGSAWVFPSQISADGRYAGVISADGAMAVAVHNYNASGGGADFYFGQNNPEQDMWCPLVFGAGYSGGWTTKVHAQNATGSAQDIQIRVYRAGETTPTVDTTQNVAANASYTFDFKNDSRFSAFTSSDYGYARLTGQSGNIAVVVDLLRERSSSTEQAVNTYSGVPTSQAGTSLLEALVFKDYSGGWNSGIGVINVGSSTATVTVTYTPSNACIGCAGSTDSLPVAPGARETFYLPDRPYPHTNWFGSAEVTSSGGNNIIALSTTANYNKTEGAVGYSLLGVSPDTATPNIAVPMLYMGAGTSNAWITGVQVRNMGAATDITLDYVRAPSCTVGNATYQWTQSVAANQGGTFYTPSHPQSIPNGWYGSVYVSSSTNNDLLASVQKTGYPLGVAGVYNGINH
jgi:outer membrane biosynthesis protein TonB